MVTIPEWLGSPNLTPNQVVQKWEYKVESESESYWARNKCRILNTNGVEGWELVAIEFTSPLTLYYKRPTLKV